MFSGFKKSSFFRFSSYFIFFLGTFDSGLTIGATSPSALEVANQLALIIMAFGLFSCGYAIGWGKNFNKKSTSTNNRSYYRGA